MKRLDVRFLKLSKHTDLKIRLWTILFKLIWSLAKAEHEECEKIENQSQKVSNRNIPDNF